MDIAPGTDEVLLSKVLAHWCKNLLLRRVDELLLKLLEVCQALLQMLSLKRLQILLRYSLKMLFLRNF